MSSLYKECTTLAWSIFRSVIVDWPIWWKKLERLGTSLFSKPPICLSRKVRARQQQLASHEYRAKVPFKAATPPPTSYRFKKYGFLAEAIHAPVLERNRDR
jgi:hypothetical protein